MKNTRHSMLKRWIVPGTLAALAALSTGQVQFNNNTGITQTFEFKQTRPRLVVLLHGVTPKQTEEPDQRIASSGHARHYWGFQFIKGLQGRVGEGYSPVVTPMLGGKMRFTNTKRDAWVLPTADSNAFDFAPIMFPMSMLQVPADAATNQKFIKDYIKMITSAGAETTMVMVTHRDGSQHLMTQTRAAIEQIYYSYMGAFNELPEAQQPQIYLVGHSFGGVVARAILANPTEADLFGVKLTPRVREMADFIRKRVVLVNTLASPHEGTILPDIAGDIADYVIAKGYGEIMSVLKTYNKYKPGEKMSAKEMKEIAEEGVKVALDNISGKRDCLQDLQRMREYNNGILKPDTARRWTNGPLVPIFTGIGRNPGGTFIDQSRSTFLLGGSTWNPVTLIDQVRKKRAPREAALLYLINSLMHLEGYGHEGKMPWGIAEHPEGDKVSSPFKGIGPNVERNLKDPWFPKKDTILGVLDQLLIANPYTYGRADGEWDSDGFCGWDSAHAYHIINQNFYRVFPPHLYGDMLPWDNDNHASIMFNPGVGVWIHNELVRDAGPLVRNNQQRRSVWSSTDNPVTPSKGIRLEILEFNNWTGDLDETGADFTLNVRLGARTTTRNLTDNTNRHPNLPEFTLTGFQGQVIPIKIDAIERDSPDPDDKCVLSPIPGQTSLYLYLDTRTGRITGDASGAEGQIIEIKPDWWGVSHRVMTKLRITRI